MAVVERVVPGIPEAMRLASMQKTDRAMLSRAAAGIRGKDVDRQSAGQPQSSGGMPGGFPAGHAACGGDPAWRCARVRQKRLIFQLKACPLLNH